MYVVKVCPHTNLYPKEVIEIGFSRKIVSNNPNPLSFKQS